MKKATKPLPFLVSERWLQKQERELCSCSPDSPLKAHLEREIKRARAQLVAARQLIQARRAAGWVLRFADPRSAEPPASRGENHPRGFVRKNARGSIVFVPWDVAAEEWAEQQVEDGLVGESNEHGKV